MRDRHAQALRLSNVEGGTKAVIQATPEGILLQPVSKGAIRRGFGLLKRKRGDKPFAQEWAEHKGQELELEDAKYARSAADSGCRVTDLLAGQYRRAPRRGPTGRQSLAPVYELA